MYKEKIMKMFKKAHLLSIADIHKKIAKANYSTIYRNVDQLVAEKQIQKVAFDKGKIMYELNGTKNDHDHFLCTDCGDIRETHLHSRNISLPPKYKILDVVVKGLCAKCHQKSVT